MAEKLNWTELRRLVASRTGVSEKNTNSFLNSFIAQLVEALKKDKQVKVVGLGTFKLQSVAPRKSVNVTTGEQIVIAGYNKIVFTPEASLKELVESSQRSAISSQPMASSKELDPIQKLGAQAEEIVDLLADLGQSPKEIEKPIEEPIIPESPVVPNIPVEEPEPAVETVIPEEPVVQKVPVAEEPKVAESPFVPEVPAEEPKKKKKKHHFLRDTLICVTILLLLLGGAYFFFREQISDWIQNLVEDNKKELVVSPKEQQEEEEVIVSDEVTSEEETTPAVEEQIETVIPEIPIEEPDVFTYNELLRTETITEGSRLAWIAKKYYGAKIYWPYLYEANKDHLSNPNQITVGTEIRVPKLTAIQKDTTNAATMALIERLRIEAIGN